MLKLKIQKTVGTFQFKLRFPSGRIRAVTNSLLYILLEIQSLMINKCLLSVINERNWCKL